MSETCDMERENGERACRSYRRRLRLFVLASVLASINTRLGQHLSLPRGATVKCPPTSRHDIESAHEPLGDHKGSVRRGTILCPLRVGRYPSCVCLCVCVLCVCADQRLVREAGTTAEVERTRATWRRNTLLLMTAGAGLRPRTSTAWRR